MRLIFKLFEIIQTILNLFDAIRRDFLGTLYMIKIRRKLALFPKKNMVTPDIFREWSRKQPNKPCIIYYDKTWTFKDMESYSNKIANFFSTKLRLKKGDCVSLFMDNRPEHVGIWLGLSKIGVIAALINSNLKNQPLLHCINVSKSNFVIYSSNLEESISTIKNDLKDVELIVSIDECESKLSNVLVLNTALNSVTDEIIEPKEKPSSDDIALFVYTSGTTGLPKPAVIKHSRLYGAGFIFFDATKLTADDVVYVSLPIYHGNGAFIGIGSAVVSGATVVLRKKFSATNFWKECIEYECTAFVYVGELCRFLVNQPPSPLDKQHKIKVAIGNGLRENVWKEFKQRFGVRCLEFYGASEGNCNLVNITGKVGACGFTPLINNLIKVYPVCLLRIDEELNPIRDENGFCVECEVGEKGLLIGLVGKNPLNAFNGYANNPEATKKKTIENVFKKGQIAFNSGDLMMRDKWGYMYFCDRLGDTFRWRGENVSTVEIENLISAFLNSAEVVVYGVEIPGEEGRAGMATIVASQVDLVTLASKIHSNLPAYARPLFIRVVADVDHTGTFKAQKYKISSDGFDITKIADSPVYYLDTKEQLYKQLTEPVYQNILKSKLRF